MLSDDKERATDAHIDWNNSRGSVLSAESWSQRSHAVGLHVSDVLEMAKLEIGNGSVVAKRMGVGQKEMESYKGAARGILAMELSWHRTVVVSTCTCICDEVV